MSLLESEEELEARHEIEVEELEAKIKDLIKTAPKKGKARDEFETSILRMKYDLKAKHIEEVNDFEERKNNGEVTASSGASSSSKPVVDKAAEKARQEEEALRKKEEEDRIIQAKRDKKKKKADRKETREQEREHEKEEMRANAGPGQRQIECDAINKVLAVEEGAGVVVKDIQADGNCLYRSVASELERIGFRSPMSYSDVRLAAGSFLRSHGDAFAPFLELEANSPDYFDYCDKVISSAEWGGHVELKAISNSFDIDIRVYSANPMSKLIVINPDAEGSLSASSRPYIILTYHLHYYALGEHYNAVTCKI